VSECREPESLGCEGSLDTAEYILDVDALSGGRGLERDRGAVVGAVRSDWVSASPVPSPLWSSVPASEGALCTCSYDDRDGAAESSEKRRGGGL
jgi:hypothetical protein